MLNPLPRPQPLLQPPLNFRFNSAVDGANDLSLGSPALSRYSFALITPVFFTIWRNMNSAKPVTPQEVSNYLERLSASSTKTLAAFSDSKCSIGSSISGQLSIDDAGIVSVSTLGTFSAVESSILET